MTVSLWGLGVVFVVLAVISLAIFGLGQLDARLAGADQRPVRSDTPSASAAVTTQPGAPVTPEIVAAIGAALALAQSEAEGEAAVPGGPANETFSGGWYASGLSRQMASRARESIRRSR